MKKLFRKLMGTVLAVSLVAGVVPVDTDAAQIQNKINTDFEQGVKTQSQNKEEDKKETSYVDGEVIVLNAGKKETINAFKKEASALGVKVVDTYKLNGDVKQEQFQVSLVKSEKYTTQELMDKFSASSNVKMVQPNYKYYAMDVEESLYNDSLWGIDNQGQNAGIEDMDINSNSEQMKVSPGEEKKEKVVAIIDTGVDYNHEELKDYIWTNPDTTRLKGEHGYDFVNNDTDPIDDGGHGTHCAGIVKSVMNQENIKIMALKFLNSSGEGVTYDAVRAYNYIYEAQKLGVNVVSVNNSWGASGEEDILLQTLMNMVGEKGAISVCAAGNEALNNDEYAVIPACTDSPYIISVAAANEKGQLASFSNYGEETIDIAAPGTNILSTVSYECFNPSLYGKDENGNQRLCSTYQDFSGSLVTPDVPGSMTFENASSENVCYSLSGDIDAQTVSLTNEEYFGKKTEDAKALQWDIKSAQAGKKYNLYLPYYQESSTTPVYLNCMLQMTVPEGAKEDIYSVLFGAAVLHIQDVKVGENGEIDENDIGELCTTGVYSTGNYWDQISVRKNVAVKTAEQRAIIISVEVNYDGDYQVKLDDLAISKSNATIQDFGKTAYLNGTSMATPYVAGAIASMANAYPTDSVENRIARIKGSVRETESLKGKVATGGMLDLSKANSPIPMFEKIAINEEGDIEITGNFFQKAEIQINGKAVKIKSQTDKKIVVEGNYANRIVHMDIKMGNNTYSKECFLAKGQRPEIVTSSTISTNKWSMVSNGYAVYCVDKQGKVCSFWDGAFNGEEAEGLMYECEGMSTEELFGDMTESAQMQSQAVWAESDLYGMAVLDTGFVRSAILVKFNWITGQWEKVTNIPDSVGELNQPDAYNGVILSTLACYNGKLYVLGGFDTNKNLLSSDVFVYDIKTGKWSQGKSMPEARYAGKAMQVGNQLIVTLGGNGTEDCPVNMIFDGNNWKLSKAKLSGYEKQTYCYDTAAGSTLTYSDGEIGLIKDGLFYVGYKADGLGDAFSYLLKEDKYVASGYSLDGIDTSKGISGVSLGEIFYLYVKNNDENSIEEFENLDTIYEIPVSDGRCMINWVNGSENGDIEGSEMYYMPGSTAELKAVPFLDCYLKSITIDGKKVKLGKTGGSVVIPVTSDVKVNAEFGKYVTEIKLDKTSISLGAGCRKKLNAKVLPEDANNKSLQFKSSNKKVVTVDNQGNLKANKNAVGKTATITVTAKDRKTVVAKCKVKVRKPVKIKKLELSTTKNKKTVKAGKTLKVKASFTPKDADNQQLVWSSSNTKYATVKDGVVTGKKAGIGKKVTITAKTKYGTKIKATIKIKIVK